MAIVSVPSFNFPRMMTGIGSGGASLATSTALTTTGNYAGMVFTAKSSFTLADVAFYAFVTSAGQLQVSVETVSSRLPTGTNYGGSTPVVTGTLSADGWVTAQTLATPASVVAGDQFAVVFRWVSGSINIGRISGLGTMWDATPLPVINGSAGFVLSSDRFSFCVSDGAGVYQSLQVVPFTGFNNVTFNNTGTRSQGMRFQVAAPMRLRGILWTPQTSANAPFDLVLSDSGGTLIHSESANIAAFNSSSSVGSAEMYYTSPPTLAAATTYYLTIEPNSASSQRLWNGTLANSAYLKSLPGGAECFFASRTTAGTGAFTDDQTKYPLMELLFNGVDSGGGAAGGMLVNPGMTGGFRG